MGPSLGTLTLGTYTNFSSTTKTGADPVLESIAAFNDGTYVSDATNSSHTGTAQFTLADMPADFKHIETLTLQVRYLASGAQTNTWQNITARVYKADGVSFLTDAATIVGGPITNTAGANSLIVTFPNPDLTATAADWNGAKVWLSWFVIRNKGGDTVQKRITAAQLTGTYAIDTSIEESEDVTVTESVTIRLHRLTIDASDTVTVTDAITVVKSLTPLPISTSDLVIVQEGQETVPKINVFEAVTVTDTALLVGALAPSVFEAVLVQDSPAVTPLEITVPVEVTAFDLVHVFEGQEDINGPQVNVFEVVTIDDTFATIAMALLRINIFDVVTVTEFAGIPQTQVLVTVFDTILVQELRLLTVSLKINCMDEVYVVDGAPVMVEFEVVTVTESVTVSIARLVISSVFEQVNLSEASTVLVPQLTPAAFDAVTLTESVALIFVTNAIPLPNVFENVTVTESVTVFITNLKITTFEDVLVEETRTIVNITALRLTVSDAVTVQEDAVIVLPYMSIEVFEAVTVVEDITFIPAFLVIEQFETFTVTDASTVADLTVNIPNPAEGLVFEDLQVADEPTIYLSRIVPEVFEDVTVADGITVSLTTIDLFIDVFEDVAVLDDFTMAITPLFIDEFTQVFLDDAVTVNLPFLVITVSDDITVLDAVTIKQSLLFINVSDEVTVTERVALRITRPGQSRRHQLPVIGVE